MGALLEILSAQIGIVRHSDWLLVDQSMIDRFADATLDRQFIHVDPVRAAATPFGGTIAHGFLTLSLLSHLQQSIPRPGLPEIRMGVNYGLDRVRFVRPVPSGSRIRAASTLVAIDETAPGLFQQASDMVVEIEGEDKPALIARWVTRLQV